MTVLSPSDQFESAPQDNEHFFEGAEKRLVIYFFSANAAAASTSAVPPDLRTISQQSWETALDLVNCKVISTISNDDVTAYLLSESSMFVTRNRVLIKTCGTTTLLHCLSTLLSLARDVGFHAVDDVYYSHKNMLNPEVQMSPHEDFDEECEYLDQTFRIVGLAKTFGSPFHGMSRGLNIDRFFLYVLNNQGQDRRTSNKNEHFKFEIIMEQMDAAVMSQFIFINKPAVTAAEVTSNSGIVDLIPGMNIDAFNFEGCGYSMNGICGSNYMTIHVTPEPAFSFVSLETDVPMVNYATFIRKVFECFKPGKFMINLMAPKCATTIGSDEIYKDIAEVRFDGFNRLQLQLAHFKAVDVIFAQYACAQ